MIGQLPSERALPLGQALPKFKPLKDWFASVLASPQLDSVLIAIISLLVLVLFSTVPGSAPAQITTAKPDKSLNWLIKQTVPAPSKSKKAAPAVMPSCAQPVGIFSNCADVSIDFAHQADGAMTDPRIVAYVGAPEANKEAQFYTANPSNLRIENGSLVLQAQDTSHGSYKYTSARVSTINRLNVQYGKLVIRAKLPTSGGTWPALWMLPSTGKYKNAAALADPTHDVNDGEIDIAEAVGTQPGVIYGIAHCLAYPPDGRKGYYGTVNVTDSASTFHDYGIEWTPTSITFTIDGQAYYTQTKQPGADYRSWPYDQPYYLTMNLALGGTWAGTDTADYPGDGVDAKALPATMAIQSINYYKYLGK
ncbi:MAG: bglA [Candidatus Saccharibacteria bacterium]|nr:bglA [Candidatus Saccharibacteria bacterium]